jgi:hypothetical protein
MIDDVQFKTALSAVVFGFYTALELVLPARHNHEPCIRTGKDAVKVGHLNIGFKHDLFFAA